MQGTALLGAGFIGAVHPCRQFLFIRQTLHVSCTRDVPGNADYTIVLTVLTTRAVFVVSPVIPQIVATVGEKRAYVARKVGPGSR
jgi:hypothetical protein